MSDRNRVTLGAFVATAVLLGGSGVGVRFSNRELPPLWGAGLRFMLAAALLVAIMVRMRLELPRGWALTNSVLYGVLHFGAAFGLGYYAFLRVHAGLGTIVFAVVPLATLLLAIAQRQERLRLAAVVGTVLSLAGVALAWRMPLRESIPVLSLLSLFGSAFCVAQAAVLVRRFPLVHPVAMNAVGMTVGAAVLLAGSMIAGERRLLPQLVPTWLTVWYLAVVGSVVVSLLYLFVLHHWAASRAAYVFLLSPFVTVVLSAWLDDEALRPDLIVGGFLVLAGVYIGALHPARAPASPSTPLP